MRGNPQLLTEVVITLGICQEGVRAELWAFKAHTLLLSPLTQSLRASIHCHTHSTEWGHMAFLLKRTSAVEF